MGIFKKKRKVQVVNFDIHNKKEKTNVATIDKPDMEPTIKWLGIRK